MNIGAHKKLLRASCADGTCTHAGPPSRTGRTRKAFSLAELLAALTIGATILLAALGVYSRVNNSASAVTNKLQDGELDQEIFQRIAEDLDKIIAPASDPKVQDTKISVKNKADNIYQSAQLIITRTYYDSKDKPQLFDEIIWQSNYDFDANSLILYRSHRGLTVEDKLLDQEKEKWEQELFVPIAAGLTQFSIAIPKGTELLQSWTEKSLPPGLKVTLSFTLPHETPQGTLEILDQDKLARTIVMDRTRNISFQVVEPPKERFVPSVRDFNLPDDLSAMDINELKKVLGLE